ncbi:ADP-L-glycero-D-manno-heptose-6-epimerase [Methylocapsa aurea]|uniref:ADP-glyceromanno-heptose 6-epimerase n=1 Tax=Methylocapsa aurea TaxID=663610 RepID=UPI003D18DC89
MIIVTGAAGFIGSNIVAALNERGINDVVLCDWLLSDLRWQNLRKRAFTDFVFPEDLPRWLEGRSGVEAIIHMGANSSTKVRDGDEIMRKNFLFTLSLIDWCAKTNVPLIYASSAATYGDGESGFVDDISFDALRKLRPLNLYGWSKHQIDLLVAQRLRSGGALPQKCIGLKFFNVYGQNEYHKGDMASVVCKMFETARRGETISLFESCREGVPHGGQRRDFIYVDDVVSMVLWCLDAMATVDVFNIGTGEARSFAEMTQALFAAVGKEPAIQYTPMPELLRDRYQYFTQASMARFRAAGYAASFTSLEQGVMHYVRNYLSREDRYR